jgi:hypothetical protein
VSDPNGQDSDNPVKDAESGEQGGSAGDSASAPAPNEAPEDGDLDPDSETDEDDIDLARLDEDFEKVAAARAEAAAANALDDQKLDQVPRRKWSQRSPLLSVAVLLVGAYLLYTMLPDFSYWMRSTPRDLGTVTDMMENGEFVEDYDNQYVVFQGTPDIQHAARVPHGEAYLGFLRIGEAGGSLFAAVPRATKEAPEDFESRFEGRIVRLGNTAIGEPLQTFFDAEEIVQIHDLETEAFVAALGKDGEFTVPLAGEDRTLTLENTDIVRVVVESPDAMVQLGRKTWRSSKDAEAAVAALGRPYVLLDRPGAPYWSFRVRAPESDHDSLTGALNAGKDVPEDNSDPKVGAMVLSRPSSFLVEPGEVAISGEGEISLVYGDNITVPGFDERDGRLVERELKDGKIFASTGDLAAVRVERRITVDQDGYVVLVGTKPADQRVNGLLFLVVCGLMGLNIASLVVGWRRRMAAQAS